MLPDAFRKIRGGAKRALVLSLLTPLAPMTAQAQSAPTFQIDPASTVGFSVDASVSVNGTFDKWNTTLTFTSANAASGVLDIKIQAASVDTGSGLKDRKLKGDDFFAAAQHPLITFHSTGVRKTGADSFAMDGDFTMRGVTKHETLFLTVASAGTGSGDVKGTMEFNRKDYGVNGSIPLVRIADRVQVKVDLKVKRTSGPALTFTN